MFIEQMPKIVDMRRYLVMEEADFPDSMQEAITSLEISRPSVSAAPRLRAWTGRKD